MEVNISSRFSRALPWASAAWPELSVKLEASTLGGTRAHVASPGPRGFLWGSCQVHDDGEEAMGSPHLSPFHVPTRGLALLSLMVPRVFLC